jgi:hypothetical protein
MNEAYARLDGPEWAGLCMWARLAPDPRDPCREPATHRPPDSGAWRTCAAHSHPGYVRIEAVDAEPDVP